MTFKRSILTQSVKYALALSLLSLPLSSYGMTNEEADLNGDGQVNFLDFYEVIKRLGAVRGTSAYRAELDLDNNGTIAFQDYSMLFGNFGQSSASLPTRFTGEVTDNQSPPNPIKGVRVELENTGIDTCTDALGQFSMTLNNSDFGENLVTFDGNGGTLSNGDPCVTEDATPGTLSGEYPVVPHKPIFINGNTDNVFRRMSLPERNLTGSALVVADGTSAQTTGNPNEFELLQPLEAGNDGANLAFESGCTIQFPDGENPRVSITQVDAAQLPVAPPPGQGSSLFVTFQPGGSSIDGCDTVEVVFDNSDMMANASDPSGPDQPGLRGVFEGAFQEIIKVFAGDFVGDDFVVAATGDTSAPLLRGEIPVPFEFAWYAVTVPVAPCPTTTVTGHVLLNNTAMDPVENARVTMGGIGPVNTEADGSFFIPNVPAGPNGARCFTTPFLLSAGASKDLNSNGVLSFDEIGGSPSMQAVPGGTTDLGTIKLGLTGVVQGEVMKLSRLDPWLTIPLPGTDMLLDPTAGTLTIAGQTDAFGNYRLENIPIGPFALFANFDGDLPLPGGGTAPKVFAGSEGNELAFNGQVLPINFNFAGFAESVEVNVFDPDTDLPLSGLEVQLDAFGFEQGGFQANPLLCFGETDDDGQVIFDSPSDDCFFGQTIPMGPCELRIFDFNSGGEFFVPQMTIGEEDGCFINEHGQVLVLDVPFAPPSFPFDIDEVQFNQGTALGEGGDPDVDLIVLRITFSEPFFPGLFDSFFGVFGQLDLDMDRDPTTGHNSSNNQPSAQIGLIGVQNVIAYNVGADVRVICGDGLLFLGGELGLDTFECAVVDENNDPIPGMENPELTVIGGGPFENEGDLVLLIPKQPLVDFANNMPGGPFGAGPWDAVLEIGVALDGYGGYGGYGGLLFDIVPNTNFGVAPAQLDPNGNTTVDDPLGDIFFDENIFLD